MLIVIGFLNGIVSFIAGYYTCKWVTRRMQGKKSVHTRTITIEVDASQALKVFAELKEKSDELKESFLFNQHKFSNKMRKTLDDQTSAVTDTNYVIDSKGGTVTGSSQKVLVDATDKTESPDGDPEYLAFNADEQASILTAANTAVQAVLDARATAAQGTTGN